ncbi:hypothetical protein Tco_0720130, partial [Tanacetum coccineum]
MNGDFPPVARNKVTQVLEVVPFEEQTDELKKTLAKNNEAKMVLYNALPKNEYERIFMCKMAKDIWQSFLKALDEGSLTRTVLGSFLGLYILNGEQRQKRKGQAIALKAKKKSSDDETSTSGSDDEEYTMVVRNFKKFFTRRGKFVRQPREEKKSFRQSDDKKGKSDRKCFRCGDSNHLIGEFQSLYETRIKRHLLGVVGAIAKMKSRIKPMMKLVSWLYRQM